MYKTEQAERKKREGDNERGRVREGISSAAALSLFGADLCTALKVDAMKAVVQTRRRKKFYH